MKNHSRSLDHLIGAMEKLNAGNGERQNVLAFIESCYGGVVRSYDLATALGSVAKMTDDEQHALIVWVLLNAETAVKGPSRRSTRVSA